ncbi:hypothetical protein SDC9_180707 [bioreactor metagenome]|uniref:YtxH-like protein n=1 Tax=bioreactor metagenome TaxID=1076179 RepID=A0A645HBP3_9ZZZZ
MSHNSSENSNSSFVFGLIIGAVIGSLIAVVIYRQNKGKIFDDLQEKLEKFFKNLLKQKDIIFEKTSTSKVSRPTTKPKQNKIIAVTSPKIETPPSITFVRKPAPKTFIKPKK